MFSKDSTWSYVINLSNGIIGVSVLTMPFCLEQVKIFLIQKNLKNQKKFVFSVRNYSRRHFALSHESINSFNLPNFSQRRVFSTSTEFRTICISLLRQFRQDLRRNLHDPIYESDIGGVLCRYWRFGTGYIR